MRFRQGDIVLYRCWENNVCVGEIFYLTRDNGPVIALEPLGAIKGTECWKYSTNSYCIVRFYHKVKILYRTSNEGKVRVEFTGKGS